MARKPKLNAETQDKILTMIRAGNFMTAAAAVAGVDPRSIYRWKAQGEKDLADGRRTRYAKFVEEMEIAEGEAESLLVDKVMSEGPKGALEILKRRFRQKWGDKIQADHSHAGPGGGPIPVKGTCTVNLHLDAPEEDDEIWKHEPGTETAATP